MPMVTAVAHTSHSTFSIVTVQRNCHIAVDESNRNQLFFLPKVLLLIINQWNFASLTDKLQRKKRDATLPYISECLLFTFT